MESQIYLLPCPFCGGLPSFSEIEEKDSRRYMEMRLECCVTMTATLGYGRFKNMTDPMINNALTGDLITNWNKRADHG